MTKPEFLFAKDKLLVTLATISVTILSPGLPIIYLTSKHWKVVLGVYFDLRWVTFVLTPCHTIINKMKETVK